MYSSYFYSCIHIQKCIPLLIAIQWCLHFDIYFDALILSLIVNTFG